MKRLMLAAVLTLACALALTGCASGAAHYTVKQVTGTAPTDDNMQADCALPAILVPAGTVDSVTIRVEWWQDAVKVQADSLVVRRGWPFTFAPPNITKATKVTATAYVRDVGGTSCAATFNQTPTVTYMPPTKVTLTSP